jgi:hypothetical protein
LIRVCGRKQNTEAHVDALKEKEREFGVAVAGCKNYIRYVRHPDAKNSQAETERQVHYKVKTFDGEKRSALGPPFIFRLVRSGNVEELRKELSRSHFRRLFDIACRDPYGNDASTMLHVASEHGHSKMVALLLKSDEEISITKRSTAHAVDVWGETALHRASRRGHVNVVRQLLRAGANPETRNRHGQSCLEIAQNMERTEVVGILLQAIVDEKDRERRERLAEMRKKKLSEQGGGLVQEREQIFIRAGGRKKIFGSSRRALVGAGGFAVEENSTRNRQFTF